MLLYKYDLVIKAESMEELLVKLDAWKYWKGKALHVNIIIWSHIQLKSSFELECVHQMPVAQHYLMMEDGGDSTW